MPAYLYDQIDVTVANYAEGQSELVLKPTNVVRHLDAINTLIRTATVDLLVNIDRQRIIDIPTTTIRSDFEYSPLDRDLNPGEKLLVGFRNNSGGAITYTIVLRYYLPA